MSSSSEIRILESAPELFRAAATQFSGLAAEAVRERGRFSVALSGGSTPKGLYTLLAIGGFEVPWENVCFFWGDERHVPPDDPESNFRMAYDAMLSKVPAQPRNILRIPAEENDAEVAARKYEQTLIDFFHLPAGKFPRFDLVLLGLGADGHTASLFPGSPALGERQRFVVANWVEELHTERITLTLPVLNHAAAIMFLVSGEEKAGILREVLEGGAGRFPSQLIQPEDGKLMWFLDQGAASRFSVAERSG
jgi:6-phosphogluconolactonase